MDEDLVISALAFHFISVFSVTVNKLFGVAVNEGVGDPTRGVTNLRREWLMLVYLFQKGLGLHRVAGGRWDFPPRWPTEEGAGRLCGLQYSAPNCSWALLILRFHQKRCGFLPNGKFRVFLLCRRLQNLGRLSLNGNLKWVWSHWKSWQMGMLLCAQLQCPRAAGVENPDVHLGKATLGSSKWGLFGFSSTEKCLEQRYFEGFEEHSSPSFGAVECVPWVMLVCSLFSSQHSTSRALF